MCGIFGIVSKQPKDIAQLVVAGLKKLEYRGYDSWGIAVANNKDSSLIVKKAVGYVGELASPLAKSTVGIGHTRWATHGGVTVQNAHPHCDCMNTIAVVHNGIVENYLDIKAKLASTHHFVSQTDSEVIVHLIEEYHVHMDLDQAVFSAFSRLKGSNSICVMDTKLERLIVCRNGSPLVIGKTAAISFAASDVTPFLASTKDVIFLCDGEGAVIEKQGVRVLNYSTGIVKQAEFTKLKEKSSRISKGRYDHFLLKEIHEQPKLLPSLYPGNELVIKKISSLLNDGSKLVITGCGTSEHAAMAGRYFLAQAGISAAVCGAYEFLPFAPFCDAKTICLVISQSGETADCLLAAKAAKANGAIIVAMVNTQLSSLERLSDFVIRCQAGPEIAVVSTKAFMAQVGLLYMLSQSVQDSSGNASGSLKDLSKDVSGWLTPALKNNIKLLARLLSSKEHIYIIGKHLYYVAALECALKLKETSYIHAEAFSSGELKHGVISLIEKGSVCFVITGNDEELGEVLSSAAEVKARNGTIVGVGPVCAEVFDYHIKTPDSGKLTLIPSVIVGQLLGYYLGLIKGVNPDKPRNLAKSVTVK